MVFSTTSLLAKSIQVMVVDEHKGMVQVVGGELFECSACIEMGTTGQESFFQLALQDREIARGEPPVFQQHEELLDRWGS